MFDGISALIIVSFGVLHENGEMGGLFYFFKN
jgi:hypothetical protein